MTLFKNDYEIITDLLLHQWDERDKKTIKSIEFDELILLHHNLGMAMRNYYKMWDPTNPHSNLTDAMDNNFPDQRSHRIIEACWKALKGVK